MELWIARDKSGFLLLFESTPIRKENGFFSLEGYYYVLFGELFPELTYEDSPKKVKLELVEQKE